MTAIHPFRQKLSEDYTALLEEQGTRFPEEDTVRIDLHCHDHNSNIPDELWGRILRLPETWLKTESLIRNLREHGATAYTITNHNNARSCWETLDKGLDVLVGSEFTCHFPEQESEVSVHVLTFGFTPEQEAELVVKRRNIYEFLRYCRKHDIPTSLPHPLYFYSPRFRPPPSLFHKLALLFERFEVLNGQRDLWQNLMTVKWLEDLTPQKIDHWSEQYDIDPLEYTANPYRKRMTGGSDDHAGLFAGTCGTLLHVPGLRDRLRKEKMSAIVLEAIRHGEMAPYGILGEEEKLNVALLDYFCQVALNMEDPGLIRMFLHRGSLHDKLACLAIGNAISEMKRHKTTMRFLEVFHNALSGRRPGRLTGLLVRRDFKPLFNEVDRLARARKQDPESFVATLVEALPNMFTELNHLLARRIQGNMAKREKTRGKNDPADLVRKLEVPSHLRALFNPEIMPKRGDMAGVSLGDIFDKLSFPLLASGVLLGSSLTSSKVLYANRGFLNEFARDLGAYQHPKRVLWLTDTLYDKNGVSTVLRDILEEVRRRDLPIDFLVCDSTIEPGPHLRVVEPVAAFQVPWYPDQRFRVPNLMEIQRLFRDGGYDRVMCSTEMLMGPIALFLKTAFKVPVYFYMHTDWLDFFEKNTSLDARALDRVRRFLRAFYRQFEGVFVLNTDHRAWLTSPEIGMPGRRVFKTAHWPAAQFVRKPGPRSEVFGEVGSSPLLLFAGRISKEKGVGVLPDVLKRVRATIPNARLVFAGTGPAEDALRKQLPDAIFTGWVSPERLAEIYSRVDLLLLPSRFDTFGCVVLEAMRCGCPVAAFDCKGPKEIIEHGVNGILAEDAISMADHVIEILADPSRRARMKDAALARSRDFEPVGIMDELKRDLGLTRGERVSVTLRLTTEFSEEEIPVENEPGFLAEILAMANVDE